MTSPRCITPPSARHSTAPASTSSRYDADGKYMLTPGEMGGDGGRWGEIHGEM